MKHVPRSEFEAATRTALPRLGGTGALCLALVLAAALIRLPHVGNPIAHPDDQFYLMAGRALLDGELLYVDIWDRKPLGLFLLYAGIGLLGGSGIVEYQLVAAGFAAATAIVVALIARRYCGRAGSLFAGVVYLAALEPLGGGAGQSPVFYSLFVAGAALLTLRASDEADSRAFHRLAAAAMALAGFAIFVKQTAVFEGCFFGIFLLWSLWTRTRSPRLLVGWGGVYAAIGIAPTLIAFCAYAAMGHGSAFWFAAVQSIFLKGPLGAQAAVNGLVLILICLAPLLAAAALGLARLHAARAAAFPGLWLAAALLGFVAVPNFFDHYALPLLPPLCVAASAAFDRRGSGSIFAFAVALWALSLSGWPGRSEARVGARQFEAAAAAVRRHVPPGGCLWVHEGPVQLYAATGACRPTRFVFPDHLNSAVEGGAIGADPEAEVARILAARPDVIVTAPRIVQAPNRAASAVVRRELERRYRLAATTDIDHRGTRQRLFIWVPSRPDRALPGREAATARRR